MIPFFPKSRMIDRVREKGRRDHRHGRERGHQLLALHAGGAPPQRVHEADIRSRWSRSRCRAGPSPRAPADTACSKECLPHVQAEPAFPDEVSRTASKSGYATKATDHCGSTRIATRLSGSRENVAMPNPRQTARRPPGRGSARAFRRRHSRSNPRREERRRAPNRSPRRGRERP